MRRNGFTLIELLVVIAIVAILAAILFPVYVTARGKAHQAACYSGLKQIGIAYMTYVQDWHGKMPWIYDFASNPPRSIRDILDRYIKADKVWRCPGQSGPELAVAVNRYGVLLTMHYAASMGTNRDSVFGQNNPYANPPILDVIHLDGIKAPARTIAFIDWHAPNPDWGGHLCWEDWVWYASYCPDRVPTPAKVHNEGLNVIWCDGHTTWMKASAVQRRHFTTADD